MSLTKVSPFMISNGSFSVAASTTASAAGYSFLNLTDGDLITVASGQTFTIDVPFFAGPYQVFAGSGNVVFNQAATQEIYPEWFGTDGIDDSVAINKAYQSSGGADIVLTDAYVMTNRITMNRANSGLRIRGVGNASITYSGASIGVRIQGAAQYFSVYYLHTTNNASTAVYMSDANGCHVDIDFLDGPSAGNGYGVFIESSASNEVTYRAIVNVLEAKNLASVVQLQSSTLSAVAINTITVYSQGGGVTHTIVVNDNNCREINFTSICDAAGVIINGAYCKGYVYSEVDSGVVHIAGTGSYNDITSVFQGAGTRCTLSGDYNRVFDLRYGATGMKSTRGGYQSISFLSSPSGASVTNPGTSYSQAFTGYIGYRNLQEVYFRPSKFRVVVVAQGNEAGSGKGIAIYDATSLTKIGEATWDGSAQTIAASTWTDWPSGLNDGFQIYAKGSSASEDLTLYSVELQYLY